VLAVLFRIPEQVTKEIMKNSIKRKKFGALIRLLVYVAAICTVALFSTSFAELIIWMDDIYTKTWLITFGMTLLID